MREWYVITFNFPENPKQPWYPIALCTQWTAAQTIATAYAATVINWVLWTQEEITIH